MTFMCVCACVSSLYKSALQHPPFLPSFLTRNHVYTRESKQTKTKPTSPHEHKPPTQLKEKRKGKGEEKEKKMACSCNSSGGSCACASAGDCKCEKSCQCTNCPVSLPPTLPVFFFPRRVFFCFFLVSQIVLGSPGLCDPLVYT